VLPTARSARFTVAMGTRSRRGGRGEDNGAACSLPPLEAATTASGGRLAAPGWNCSGAGARSTAASPSVERRHGDARAWGKLGEAVAAQGECERAIVAKKGGVALACGSFMQRPPRLPRTRCGLTRSKHGRVSRRGRERRRGWSAGPRCGGAGPRAVAERPAGGERNRGGEGEGEEDADVRAPGVGEKRESGGG
jgi:hypothetical protein